MNGNVKCVEKQSKNNECMHVKWKFVVIIVWNNSIGIKFHFYHLATILWDFIFYFYSNEKVFYNFRCYSIDENGKTNCVIFQFRILKGMLESIRGLNS
jgi:hypothetical protein